MTRPRKIMRSIANFPHLRERPALIPDNPTALIFPTPIMALKDFEPPIGYAAWKRTYKKRKKSA